ncbi:MAG: hypothetical protein NZM27_12575, partial [Acetobacteraceae bacterium]|nr:hypothetical protein [Acetobacteraceae bacterium]
RSQRQNDHADRRPEAHLAIRNGRSTSIQAISSTHQRPTTGLFEVSSWPEGAHFTAARRAVRVALRESGLQAELDEAALAVLG